MKKRTLVVTLILTLVVSCIPAVGFAADSNKQDETTKLDAPKIKSTMKSTKNVVIKWNKVNKASGYILYKSKADGTGLTKIKTFKGAKKTKYSAKVKPGSKNYYVVKAYSKKSDGEQSKTLKVKTPKLLTPKSKGYKQTNAYKVIKAARSKLGRSYVYGASGPNSFDCSGYVYYIMNKTGAVKSIKTKKFSRSSAKGEYSQLRKYNIGSKSLKKAQPGDIVFFSRSGSTSNIHHVGIYYGNGKIIHASSPSTGVIISPKQHRKVAAIVRLPKL